MTAAAAAEAAAAKAAAAAARAAERVAAWGAAEGKGSGSPRGPAVQESPRVVVPVADIPIGPTPESKELVQRLRKDRSLRALQRAKKQEEEAERLQRLEEEKAAEEAAAAEAKRQQEEAAKQERRLLAEKKAAERRERLELVKKGVPVVQVPKREPGIPLRDGGGNSGAALPPHATLAG